jgi:GTPase
VESFKSTLDELRYADLVLLMVDASEPLDSIRTKFRSCRETLSELEVDLGRILLVLNKMDLLPNRGRSHMEEDPLFRDFDSVSISATEGYGLRQLRNHILRRVILSRSRQQGPLSKRRD